MNELTTSVMLRFNEGLVDFADIIQEFQSCNYPNSIFTKNYLVPDASFAINTSLDANIIPMHPLVDLPLWIEDIVKYDEKAIFRRAVTKLKHYRGDVKCDLDDNSYLAIVKNQNLDRLCMEIAIECSSDKMASKILKGIEGRLI